MKALHWQDHVRAVTAADIAVIPQAWPSLEIRRVFCSRHVTLSTLADLADRCPRLWRLCIYVDAASVPDISVELHRHSSCGTRTPAKLRILEVAESPVRDLTRVAAFLVQRLLTIRKIFPCGGMRTGEKACATI
ncbi:hypothetical protein BV22DRAFT_1036394 [Leucogyrophana mollusca]|uniref:Uncharacterized protein n=1 Tax=Leucogyrophana mollusca TaxID=85980 RepID=A0ACB8BCE5_9AGAM|nr:hypothetical protein BV22DRAFT_1036394 [Leucogyrophana mollusca]